MRNSIVFYVNGQRHELHSNSSHPYIDISSKTTCLQYLRKCGLTGTKLGCAEGGCGACTVDVSKYDLNEKKVYHLSVNACLAPLYSLDLCMITTIEGIGNLKNGLHPIQKRIAEFHGSQCGFCTPGIVMALFSLLHSSQSSQTMESLEHSFDGNLCRCTGYRPILDAAKSFAVDKMRCKDECKKGNCSDIEDICQVEDGIKRMKSCSRSKLVAVGLLNSFNSIASIHEFPEEIKRLTEEKSTLHFFHEDFHWYSPTTLKDLFAIKASHPNIKLLVGNTEIGIETKFKNQSYPVLVYLGLIEELQSVLILDDIDHGVQIGGSVTLTNLSNFFKETMKHRKEATRTLSAFSQMLQWFASSQVRNVASIAGNIVTASPISDLNPLLIACGATFELGSSNGSRKVQAEDFFLSYRKVDIRPDEVLVHIFIPFMKKWEYLVPFKQARRREDDISVVTAGMRIQLQPTQNAWVVKNTSLAFGGMAPITKLAKGAIDFLKNKEWNKNTVEEVMYILAKDMALSGDVPGGMIQYRQSLCLSFLFKFYVETSKLLQEDIKILANPLGIPQAPVVEACLQSSSNDFLKKKRPLSSGNQEYVVKDGGLHKSRPIPHKEDIEASKERTPVGDPLMHKSAYAQASGEAIYTDDIPSTPGTLYAALVLTKVPRAKILNVNPAKALALKGVRGFFDSNDVMGENAIGAVIKDEECFISEECFSVGQPIGIIVAETPEIAEEAVKRVDVTYDKLPAIFTIEEAIQRNSYYGVGHVITCGNVDLGFENSDVIIEGQVYVGGQEHFYLETNATLCIPEDHGGMTVFSSTQNPTKTQSFVASVIGVPSSKVVCRVKRMGGGFGGKESRSVFISCAVAVAAHKLRVPVKISLDRDVDMSISGTRHPFFGKYRLGSTSDGMIQALDLQLFSNGGYSWDLSESVMDRALFHCENAYNIPNVRAVGKCCKTNIPSNTAFRGFGGPQGMFIAETYMDHLSHVLHIDSEKLRRQNLYATGCLTPYRQKLQNMNIQSLWDKCKLKSSFETRKLEVELFNRSNRYRKRGISIIPTKFGINFTAKFMNQGGALVHVYTDGSVLVSHGGTEMGQGLHTKVIQIVSKSLGISHEKVIISETATDKVPNSSPTAASMGTDLYGMAALDACEQIKERLSPIIKRMPDATFEEIVSAAYFERINLSAQGFYITESSHCGYDWNKNSEQKGQPFNYFTTGVACSEVEVDALTGDLEVLRTDIVMDVGASINPAIDIGQIEGAFVQGYGLFLLEELVWGDSAHQWVCPGNLFTKGPGTYKIPSANDIPIDFRIYLDDSSNPFAVHSSKAIGEPPLFLASSVFFAAKQAVMEARKENGLVEYYCMNSPATAERLRMACVDHITQRFTGTNTQFQPLGSF